MRKYINEIFVVRAIACLSIVMLHSINFAIGGYREGLTTLEYFASSGFGMLLYFGTPTFILISEILIANSYKDEIPKGFLKKRVKFILLPYVAMAVFYAIVDMRLENIKFTGSSFLLESAKNIFLGDWHGYFVLIIFQFYILHALLYKKLKRWNPKKVLLTSLIINVAYLSFFALTDPIPIIPYADYIWERLFWMPFIGWIFYFFLGYYIGANYQKFITFLSRYRVSILVTSGISTLLLMAFTLLDVFNRTSKRPDMILYTCSIVFIIFIIASLFKKTPKLLGLVSQYSFGIYFLHYVFLEYLFQPNPNTPFAFYVIMTFLGSLVISMLIIYVLNMLPLGKYIVGKIGAKPKNKIETEQKARGA